MKTKKLFFQIKHISIVLTLSISLLFSSVTCANEQFNLFAEDTCPTVETNEPSTFQKSYGAVNHFLNKHEYFLVPISGAMAGGSVCGFWCVLIGGGLGAVDEVLVSLGITDQHYLVWGILGVATANSINPSTISHVIGGVVGVLLPTGVLNEHSGLVVPVISGLAGASISGPLGFVDGVAASLADNWAIESGYTDKHYLTFGMLGLATGNLLDWFGQAMNDVVGMFIAMFAVEHEEEIATSLQAPINTAHDLYDVYGKFLPSNQLNSHLAKHAIVLIGSQFFTQSLSLYVNQLFQGVNYNLEHLDSLNSPAWGNVQSGLVNIVIFIFPYMAGHTVSGGVDSYFSENLQHTVGDAIRNELFSEENALRLVNDPNGAVLIDNLSSDIGVITRKGSGLITSAVSSSIRGIYGFGILSSTSPNIFIYSFLLKQGEQAIKSCFVDQIDFYDKEHKAIESDITSVTKHDVKNIRTVTEREGVGFTAIKLQQLYDALRENQVKQKVWNMAENTLSMVSWLIDDTTTLYLVGREINAGRVPFDSRTKVQRASGQVSGLLSWSARNALEIMSVNQALGRINELEEKIHPVTNSLDQISRSTEIGDQLKLQDLEISIEKRVLVRVSDMSFNLGKVYAVTGESGCGKTSLLAKIKGIKENGISGTGNIYYPLINGVDPKIVMVSQQDYFPLKSSLWEVLNYPDYVSAYLEEQKRKEAVELLQEIGLDVLDVAEKDSNGLSLDSVRDWDTGLSGGEKKKILMASCILKNPDILILDEVFNGLDPDSIKRTQQALKKHLPNTLMFIVDHHAQDNNYDAFYDQELNFSDQSVVLKD